MLLVLPISRSDAHLTESLVKAFEKFPPGANHNLLVIASPNAAKEGEVLLNHSQKFFSKSALEILPSNNDYDWPRACNHYFQQTCYLIPKYCARNQGWMWFEMDAVAMTANWLTILEQQYYGDAKRAHSEKRNPYRFMGTTEQTLRSYGGEFRPDGHHMASVGIYPGDFLECPVLKAVPTMGIHFAANLKWYPLKSLNITPLIQNNRETANYRLEEGKIVCDSVARNAWDVHWNDPVSEKAVILHGCKDGTLIDILPSDRKVEVAQQEATIPSPKIGKPFFSHVSPFETAVLPHPQPSLQNPVIQQAIPETTPVVHEKLPAPNEVRTFGQLVSSETRKAVSEFDENGMPTGKTSLTTPVNQPDPTPTTPVVTPTTILPIVAPINVTTTDTPAAQPTPQKAPAKIKRGRKMRRSTISEEERQRRSDRMKARHAERKAQKELAVC